MHPDLFDRPGIRALDTNGRIDMNGNWKKHVTFDRVLLIVTMLFAAGQYWERQQNTNEAIMKALSSLSSRVEAIELRSVNAYSRDEANSTFVRKDVVEVRLEAIEMRMSELKELILKRR
jgi:hypothetical protein